MEKRKYVFSLVLTAALLSFLWGCGGERKGSESGQRTADGKEKVTVALWGDQLTEGYGKYLQETFPEVEFEFYAATNSTDFYRFKEERGELPDILTVRRFSLNDVASWKDSLMDLSDTDLVNRFHQSYLRSYTYSDGTVNWLPTCAEIDSILINKDLLEENGMEIPLNYQEFTDTCAALKELGIRPFLSNFGADYTCMEILQGLSVSELTSQEGREWRQQYESGQTEELSEEVWMPVFERMQDFIEYAGITEEDLEGDTAQVYEAYKNREVAMIRTTSNESVKYEALGESVLMPYYGEREENNWYLTYPAFQVAANVNAEESPERKELILRIMTAMLNEDGLHHITNGENMIAYSKDVTLDISPLLSYLPACSEDNRLYIRLASSDMFSISQKVVQGMITGKYPDARSAFEAFNEEMKTDNVKESAAAHIDRDYSYGFNPHGGSQAASAIMNTLREELETDLLVGQACNVAGNICAGDYTETELRFLTMGESMDILLCHMTGEQLYQYMDYVLTVPGRTGSVINDSTLYVSSGFEMEIQKTDNVYQVNKLTVSGKEIEKDGRYFVAVLGNEAMMHKEALASVGITEYERVEAQFKQIIVDRLAKEGKQLASPTDYITLKSNTP